MAVGEQYNRVGFVLGRLVRTAVNNGTSGKKKTSVALC